MAALRAGNGNAGQADKPAPRRRRNAGAVCDDAEALRRGAEELGLEDALMREVAEVAGKDVFCQVVIGQCGVSFPSEKAVGFSPVRNWPVIARVLLFHCIRA